ncbi:hypothetical protein NW762_014084 [Fusarium torreyae]|uniref:Methyltransferase domain-containing protein n=1 Tax=Fusarium torreyae TaxID=1237075 RepID=A0A9W8RMQ5_9HYPO|nr:hypothetical protein NW762_014084 [Fusarium torreyae]
MSIWNAQTYREQLPDDFVEFRKLLEGYSRIPPDAVENHLHAIRDKAWAVASFPCVGMWSFTNLNYMQDPQFKTVISRLRDGSSDEIFLDVACGLGQVLRKLSADGVDPKKLYGTDILPEYLELGFDLFKDRDRFEQNNFITADLIHNDKALAQLEGKITVVHASNFFHLFGWEEQILIGENIVKLFERRHQGVLLFGWQIGRLDAGTMTSYKTGNTRYLHNLSSLQTLWDDIGAKTETKWKVDAELLGKLPFQIPGFPEDTRYLKFSVSRLEVAQHTAGQAVADTYNRLNIDI